MVNAEEQESQVQQRMSEKDHQIHQVDVPWRRKKMPHWRLVKWVRLTELIVKENSQGKDPRTFDENSQGRDLAALEQTATVTALEPSKSQWKYGESRRSGRKRGGR